MWYNSIIGGIMKVKVFRTIDEQILILQNKGMIIDDIDFVKSKLL